ncbi:hypothetical protein [Streptomyces sp. NPDC050504]|uniref:hypothetical protein n=1 Tax=Streptomyces sp. NPDC050504 TaxID=3365618 RepID=UPI00379D37C9
MTDRVLELLRARPDLADLAAFPFDFDVDRARHVEDVHLASGKPLEPIAGDDTGGTYFLCDGGAVLYASSEGDAVLIAESVREALEMSVRLPGWCEDLAPGLDEEGLRAAVRAGDDEAREEFAPELDAQRAALLEGLGLPDRPLAELYALAESAAARTEPDHLLLNSRDLCAYRLHASYRQSLRDVALRPGRTVLERIRSGDAGAGEEAAADPVLREGVLRAAREEGHADHDGDPALLRPLLEREAAARHGLGLPEEDEFTWIELAHRQGLVEPVRVELIRMLDDTGPNADRLRRLSRALERLGDHAQAARAQYNLVPLQDTGFDRAAQAHVLARLERLKGDLAAAGRALARARAAVGAGGTAPDETVAQWHRKGLGRQITEQHLELVLAAIDAEDAELARTTMAHGKALLDTIGKQWAKSLSPLSTRAKWAVAALRTGPADGA